jgi:transposase
MARLGVLMSHPAFVSLHTTIRADRERILDAVELGVSNSKLEGLNAKICLINHRDDGHRNLAASIAMIPLCGEITVQLPFQGA